MAIKELFINIFSWVGIVGFLCLSASSIYLIRVSYKYLPSIYEKTKCTTFPNKLDLFGRMWILFDYINAFQTKKDFKKAMQEENFDKLSKKELKILKLQSRSLYIGGAITVVSMIILHFLGVNFSEHP